MKGKIKKTFYLLMTCIFLSGCVKTGINSIHNCVIIKQHCGFDNLEGGYYQVKYLETGIIKRIDVDIRDCDIYNVGDTIK